MRKIAATSTSNATINRTPLFSYRITFLIGLGFFTTGISWALYNSYVPLWLNEFIPDRVIVGLIMGLDNLVMIFMEPFVGTRSDNTRTRFGRRMPYLLIGIPISALFLAILPLVREQSLIILMAAIIAFLLMMAFYRAPVVALMPDLVESQHRSKANGVINLMGGLGAVYAFLFGSMLYSIDPFYAFVSTSIIMILALILLFAFVKETPKTEIKMQDELVVPEKVSLLRSFGEVFSSKDKSLLLMFFAIFFWFVGYNALETWFTSWGTTTLPYITSISVEKEAEAAASIMLTTFSLVFVLFAIPAGLLGQKLGRIKTIKIGIPVFAASVLGGFLIGNQNILSMDASTQYYSVMISLLMGGLGWALININSIVIVWEIGTDKKLGIYTGLYYFFSSSAAVFGPAIVGLLFDVLSGGRFELLFPISFLCLVIAFILMFGVKSGEVDTRSIPNSG